MSIMTARRVKSTRPASIRPVPATFGAGILPTDEPADDWGVRFDRAQREYRERNRKPVASVTIAPADPLDLGNVDVYAKGWDAEIARARLAKIAARTAQTVAELDAAESFADELVAAVNEVAKPRRKAGNAPSREDQAWDLGYRLGRDGIDAAPYHATHAEAMAFQAGHERGMVAYRDDQRAEVEALIAMWEMEHGPDVEEAEFAEAGSCVGHDA